MKILPALVVLSLVSLAGPTRAGDPNIPCLQPNVAGTALLPAACDFVGAGGDTMEISNGLPAGTTIVIEPTWHEFFNIVRAPGGVFPGGEIQTFDSILGMKMTGTGALLGFNRNIAMQVSVTTHSDASSPGSGVQPMDLELISFQGQIFGDPDFDVLGVSSGALAGLPSSGHTTLTRQGAPGNPFAVDSLFDVVYEINFVGAPGSVLDGLAGTTQSDVTLRQGGAPWAEWSAGKPCGSIFVPELRAKGTLSTDSWNVLEVVDAPPVTPAFLVVGLSPLRQAFKGGILGPTPDIIKNLNTDASGEIVLQYQWPAVPSGFRVWVQVWFQQVSQPDPFCSTPTLVGTSP